MYDDSSYLKQKEKREGKIRKERRRKKTRTEMRQTCKLGYQFVRVLKFNTIRNLPFNLYFTSFTLF